jgi:hypothetical protein
VTTLIAIPYWGVHPDLLDKAVRHALAQTDEETVVLVTGDGQKPPVAFTNDRLVVGTFPEHHGAPFVQQAMLLGSRFAWYAPHGADDWIEPDHVESLLELGGEVNGSGVIWFHQPSGPLLMKAPRTFIEFGVLSTLLLREIGGYGPHEPCGQDSVLISLLAATSPVHLSKRPTYHKLERADSLTHDPATRSGSPLRTAVRLRNHKVLEHCRRLGYKREAIRQYRATLVPPELAAELEDRAADVSRWLS